MEKIWRKIYQSAGFKKKPLSSLQNTWCPSNNVWVDSFSADNSETGVDD